MWLALISTSFIVLSALFVAWGWFLIRRDKRAVHQKVMIWASVFAVIFFVSYVSRMLIIGTTEFGGPDSVKTAYLIFLAFHIVLSIIAAVLGLTSLYLGFRQKFAAHKRIGPWTSIIWFLTAFTGVTVYLLLYVVFEPGPTVHMFKLP
jgi:putative membrane protein